MNSFEQKKYYPQLDAIRGIGIICIFFYHAYRPSFTQNLSLKIFSFFYSNLYLSIDLFFVLSAFLITLLALNEIEKKGNFSFKNYFIRRALRIWPLYYFIMFVVFVLIKFLAIKMQQPISLPPASWYLFFISNFYTENHVFFLQQLWTLSVEEQFYVLWGVSLLLFAKKIKILIVLFALASITFNFYAALNNMNVYFHSLTYLNEMMAGAFLAYSLKKNNKLIQFVHSFTEKKALLFYLFIPFFFLCYFFLDNEFKGKANNILYVIMRMIFICHCCLLVAHQMIKPTSVFNLANKHFFVYAGKISYGLYCFHGFVLTFGAVLLKKLNTNIHPFLYAIFLLGITFLIASLSYQFIEKPFLRLKDKLRRI